jgi:hypothetical protein
VKARLDTLRLDASTGPRWGAMSAQEMAAWQNFLLASGAIRRRLDAAIYFNASFVDRVNEFAAGEVRARAREFRPG